MSILDPKWSTRTAPRRTYARRSRRHAENSRKATPCKVSSGLSPKSPSLFLASGAAEIAGPEAWRQSRVRCAAGPLTGADPYNASR